MDQRARGARADRTPLLLVTTQRQRRIVAACCEASLATGIRVGMPLAHARALLARGTARVMDASPRRDRATLRRIAERMMRFSPVVTPDPPDGVLLDIAGCAHLFGGERAMRERVCRWLARLGLTARVSIAPTIGCAWAVARYAGDDAIIVPERGERAAMEPLPVASLRVPGEALAGFAELSIETVGHLLALPRALVPARLGLESLRRLDEAVGGAHEWVEPLRPREPIRAECVFEGPTTHLDAVEHATRRMIDQLLLVLRERACGVTRLELEYARADLAPERLSIVLTRPSVDAKHLWKLVAPRLERLHMGYGVTGVRAHAANLSRLEHAQTTMHRSAAGAGRGDATDTSNQRRVFAELLDALTNRLGANRVLRVALVESHIPERSVRLCSVLDQPSPDARAASGPACAAIEPVRPSLLFDEPEAADVIAVSPDGPVHRLVWRSREHTLVACVGPERIEPEWWRSPTSVASDDGHTAARDYYRVQNDAGLWLWLFRERPSSRWFVHGVWA